MRASPKTTLIVINKKASQLNHWRSLNPLIIGKFSIYSIWRVDRSKLEQVAKDLRREGINPTWENPRPENF